MVNVVSVVEARGITAQENIHSAQEQPAANDAGHVVTAIEFQDCATFYRPDNLVLRQDNPYSLLADQEDDTNDDDMGGSVMTPLRVHCSTDSTPAARYKRHVSTDDDDYKALQEALETNASKTAVIAATINQSPHFFMTLLNQEPESATPLGHVRTLQRYVATRASSMPEQDALHKLDQLLNTDSHPTSMVRSLFGDGVGLTARVALADFDLVLLMLAPELYSNDAAIGHFINAVPSRLRQDMLTDWTLAQLLQCPADVTKVAATAAARRPPAATTAPSSLPSLSICSLNTNNITNKISYILNTFSLSHDVAFYQETRFPNINKQDSAANAWSSRTNGDGRWFCCSPRFPLTPTGLSCRGVATTVHPTSALHDLHIVAGHDAPPLVNRYLLVCGRLDDRTVYLHNVYAPAEPPNRPAFFDALPRDFAADALHIIGGDFNVTLSDALDVSNPSAATRRGRRELISWLNALAVVDIFRHVNPTLCSYTSPTTKTRIDYIFVSRPLVDAPHVVARHVFGTTKSNHAAVAAHIADTTPAGKGPWKMPPWLLDDPEAADTIHAHLDTFLATARLDEDLGRHYDTMLFSLRHQLCLLHAVRVAEDRAELKELERRFAQSMYDLSRH
ncbi:hypothetical protein SDRG_10642 [Saprolegnia diclina VS20]|uniref:Endonuclease/exonuclease/phosphatase domain-containing protein n=1 Tax=Saprolegnia diclina (strain VS20) TaxID=1156394 RepID=T0RHR5_SAPDV|nr:hypothetical protein SDRG_10642 [Saprolegnia diclina VS20]EQC31858.1 hypothetical protein SDRG_10642 [Saprolegnia diclina VS20]|eukprot:XP_008614865.1 hypothetical protein SDRG_10642 [Saprolegnia diclina VS20]